MNTNAPKASSREPLKVGVVGLGRAGWNIHIQAMKGDERFRVVDVADPSEERRAEATQELGCRAFASLEELLREGESEIVVVATPNLSHEADAIAVLESGRHCICEKPMAGDYEGAKRVAAAAEKSGRKLFVHHQHLFSTEHQFITEIVESGLIGELQEVRYNWVSYARRNDWQTLKKNGGGLLNNHGPHAMSTLLALLGAPVVHVSASVKHIKDAGDADDHVHVFLKAQNGRVADAFLSTCCALPLPKFVLIGSTGAVVSQDGQKAKLRYYDGAAVPKLEVVEGPAAGRKYGNGEVLPWKEEEREVRPSREGGSFFDNVYEVLRSGAPKVVTPESAVEVMRVIGLAHACGA